jgi:hypothetical protein
LIFNGDYLTAVIITINFSSIAKLNNINQFLVFYSSKEIMIDDTTRKFKIFKIMYYTTFFEKRKQVIIIYGKPRFIQKHLLLLIS